MAEEVALKLTVDAVNAANSVKELKNIIKAAADEAAKFEEGSKEFNKFAKVAAEAKDKIGDFREKLAGLNPDAKAAAFGRLGNSIAGGFQAATAAAALFGAESEDLQKSLLKVQAATALAQGVQQVNELGKSFNTLGVIIKSAFASNPLGAILTAVLALGAALAALYVKFKPVSAEVGKLNDELKVLQETNKKLNAEFDKQILLLEAAGESEEKILEFKKKKIELQIQELKLQLAINEQKFKEAITDGGLIDSTLKLLGYEEAAAIRRGANAAEYLNSIKEQKAQLDELSTQLQVTEIKITKTQAEENKKRNEDFIKSRRERNEQLNKDFAETFNNIDRTIQKTAEAGQMALREVQSTQQAVALTLAETIQVQATALDDFNTNHQNTFNSVLSLFDALEKLSEGNSKSQKAFAVSQAIINSYLASTKALATLPPPANFIGAAAALLNGFASVKGILKTPSKTGSTPATPSFGGGNGLPGGSVDIKQFTNSQSTLIPKDANGDVKNTRVYVLEKDITSTQEKVSSIETKALIK